MQSIVSSKTNLKLKKQKQKTNCGKSIVTVFFREILFHLGQAQKKVSATVTVLLKFCQFGYIVCQQLFRRMPILKWSGIQAETLFYNRCMSKNSMRNWRNKCANNSKSTTQLISDWTFNWILTSSLLNI